MGVHVIWFPLRLPQNVWTKPSSNDPAGSDGLEEWDQHVIS